MRVRSETLLEPRGRLFIHTGVSKLVRCPTKAGLVKVQVLPDFINKVLLERGHMHSCVCIADACFCATVAGNSHGTDCLALRG